MNAKLNHLLANLVVEYHKLQNFHWYAKGQDFFQVHAKLEEYYDGVNAMVDEVAELILMQGSSPLASMESFLKEASIEEAPAAFLPSSKIVPQVIGDFEEILKDVESVKAAADEAGNSLVSAKMDGYVEQLAKSLWMMRQQQMS